MPTLKLNQPLRDVRLLRSGDRQSAHQQELQASYERGRLDGERALSEQLIRQRSAVAELQNGVLAALRHAVPQVIRDTEDALVDLAIEVARKIVAGAPIDTTMVKASIQEAIAQAADTSELTVQLHPADLALLQANSSPLLNQTENQHLRFLPSSQVSRGGCVVQTRFGVVDARRETRVELLRNALNVAPARPDPAPTPQPVATTARGAETPALVVPPASEPAVRPTVPQTDQPVLQP